MASNVQDSSNAQDVRELANPNWKDPNDRRCIAACLVNIVYKLERGNKNEEMVKQWCKLLKFEVNEKIIETTKGKEVIFGAIFKWVGGSRKGGGTEELQFPLEVAAFRGTIPERSYILRTDIEPNWNAINARHGSNTRVDIGLQCLERSITRNGTHNIWIAGHSLGAATAMAIARKMNREDRAKMEAHLFNPPFFSPRLLEIKFFEMVGRNLAAVRDIWRSLGLGAPNALDYMMINDEILCGLYNDFIGVSGWIPNVYVNKNDPICCSYIRYFEVMQGIYKKKSKPLHDRMKYLFSFEVAEDRTPWHLIPCANLFVRDTNNHCLHQWWSRSLKLEGRKYAPPVEAQTLRV